MLFTFSNQIISILTHVCNIKLHCPYDGSPNFSRFQTETLRKPLGAVTPAMFVQNSRGTAIYYQLGKKYTTQR